MKAFCKSPVFIPLIYADNYVKLEKLFQTPRLSGGRAAGG
jgi:hypothetical protein